MIVIPTGTDAPIYHWPSATVALIVINVATFFLVPPEAFNVDPDDEAPATVAATRYERYALALGNGLHPVQWVTHNFLHSGFLPLAGNMLFIWAFGIVVEGKLGPFKYLIVYLLIGLLHGAFTQTLLLRSGLSGHAVGASAVVFGLLGMCMIWAPRNELNCLILLFTGFRSFVFHWNLRYTTVALLYLGERVISILWGGALGRAVVTELGDLSGAFWGTLLAIVMVKARWVDCEGWDVFTLADKNRRLAKDWKLRGERLDRQKRNLRPRRSESEGRAKSAEDRAAAAVQRVRKLIDMGDFAGAAAAYDKSARTLERWPPQAEHMELIKAMHAAKADVESIPLMRAYCRNFPADATRVRLKLAQVLIRERQRPAAALRVLAELPAGGLPPDLDAVRQKLAKQAAQMQADGVLELEGDD
ncbi:MAG: rhomboid family intramembrane serine protease [Isosphaeraceae bacterium]|nr:rhomboid family intramembrane serine protease [Isosphaeraceae bacterium]